MVVAIDGPCGSGKGTIAKILSEKLNLVNIDIKDEKKIIELSKKLNVEFKEGKVFLDGKDVSKKIREKEVTQIVSPISSIIEVRKNMVELQRRMASTYDVILEGRDITTVVFPNAEYKFYLDASLDERVNRRVKQNKEMNIDMSEEEIRKSISDRDYNDMNKPVGALKRTEDQIYIDSTNMPIDEVIDKMISIIKK